MVIETLYRFHRQAPVRAVAGAGAALDAYNRRVEIFVKYDRVYGAGVHAFLARETGLPVKPHAPAVSGQQRPAHADGRAGWRVAPHAYIGQHLALKAARRPHANRATLNREAAVTDPGAGEHAPHAGDALLHLNGPQYLRHVVSLCPPVTGEDGVDGWIRQGYYRGKRRVNNTSAVGPTEFHPVYQNEG